MRATLALVGRPNVGKSTLFNRLTRRRDALVADLPGLTRDRRYGRARLGDLDCTLIDTGGLLGDDGVLTTAMEAQAERAMSEADLVLLLVDARAGLTAVDLDIAARLRRAQRRVVLVVNKMDGVDADLALAEFSRLGFESPVFVAAAHGRGIETLAERVQAELPSVPGSEDGEAGAADGDDAAASASAIRVAIIGRPNVGKSTLTNRLLGEERQVVFDQPGTTRDAIEIPFRRGQLDYVLIDTAGVRRKGRVDETVEKFSVVKTLDAIEHAHVVVLVLDAQEGLVDQDLHLLSYAEEAGAGIIIALNKWDGLSAEERERNRRLLDRRLRFAPWIPVRQISALHGTGVGHLLDEVNRVYRAGAFDVSTSHLTRLLEAMVGAHPPPAVRGRVIKLRFAHKAGEHPPKIVIHGNQTRSLPASYVRYLENGFREALDLVGSPVHVELRTGDNPYAGRKNTLTPRQQRSRKRMVRHHKK
ncbi:MAG: ribosome biogenesis GTPase Der [Pseudomonadales bacterium]